MIEPVWRRYDEIGEGYRGPRTPDPRIAEAIRRELGGARRILNLGAGAGSYEPADRSVIAVEPSRTMLRQRPADAAPAIEARAESLPFADQSFDLATGFLTIHHWSDLARGLAEARRVAKRVLLLTWIGFPNGFWLMDYFPEIEELDAQQFPTEAELHAMLGGARSIPVPIPRDCRDGFLCAYWSRPYAYLDPEFRRAISSFARIGGVEQGVARLAKDLASGEWDRRIGRSLPERECDFGYRIVISEGSTSREPNRAAPSHSR